MPYGSPWSEEFVRQLSDKEVRREFVADQIRARIALLIRSLREQPDRDWTQAELGERAGKPQNVISRFEDPNYGKMSLQSLFDLAAAFDLPVWIDMPEWKDWFELINDVPNRATRRSGFDLDKLVEQGLEYSRNENTPIPSSGGAASAAAEAVKNTVMAPPQMHQILTAPLNENALSAGSNQLPLEKIDSAITSAVLARSVAA
jgi:transcriptional regulator with XRE-family HTH domain